MAKCFNCGKIFDYENYYGICPKCGTYNKEKLEEEMHEELHQQYDEGNPHEDAHTGLHQQYDEGNPHEDAHAGLHQQYDNKNFQETTYGGSSQNIYVSNSYAGMGKNQHPKASGASIAVLVLLIVGIVVGVLFPIGYFIAKSFNTAGNIMAGEDWEGLLEEYNAIEDYENYEEDFYNEPENQVPQNPEIITVNPGETFSVGTEAPCTISVESAEVAVRAGIISDFPAGENLVAVKVNYENFQQDDTYYNYYPVDVFYVGYNGIFKRNVEEYALMGYEDSLPQMNLLDTWELTNDANGSGVFLFFVPVDVTEVNFYVESRSEKNNDIVEIYSVPLQINTGEGL